MIWRLSRFAIVASALSLAWTVNVLAEPVGFSSTACKKRIEDSNLNEIVKTVFVDKIERLAETNVLPMDFWTDTKDLGFAICDNGASYDSRVYYGKGVIFDLQMVIYFLAQSRALMVGRYIGLETQFTVYEDLVNQFVLQTASLKGNPLDIIKAKAIALGVDEQTYEGWIVDAGFQKREQTLFLLSLYFVSLHERCHVALGHKTKVATIRTLHLPDQVVERQKLELEADACAIDIINADEAQTNQSPISFFAVMMTISTQEIIAHKFSQSEEQTHPGTKARLAAAKERVLTFIANGGVDTDQKYTATIKGTSAFFEGLLDTYSIPE